MKHWREMRVAALHSHIGPLFTRDDAIVTEKRGTFLANSLVREITR
jgi:hypothetical protein